MVYADSLQAEGDPRGEVTALQAANAPAAVQLFDTHAEAFLGPLVDDSDRAVERLRRIPKREDDDPEDPYACLGE